ncbi:DUF481 domain-containing protein [Ectothiorhodospira lacustris]|uniref:DUF481 domain-containing protein n=1 Tax=Ectothiorhodospira lacustris TaxID=2899127 RepID=UPI001EE90401|nr:DUF481 domain-containing protein [Ectothiorhodospira lacustris]MCG5501424.1 DUF481 domain-containing protein [Ectothiorhodospira lacustris]MCG5508905.1 DUF481 domain-containing protein [Ectothiorhodospira lacustris]MCG5520696.1 DUF481 domain-containing protein [Ectothiorhodospira lacustris]
MRFKELSPYCISLLLPLISLPLQAGDWGNSTGWSGQAELGAILTSGNTDSDSLNARTRIRHERALWRHTLQLEGHLASEDGTTTKERYLGAFQSDHKVSDRDYLFGALRAERDRFSGYEYQRSLATGYGRRVVDSPQTRLHLEAGAGLRQDQPANGDQEDEIILRLVGALDHRISDNTRFTEDLLIQAGEENTEIESVAALRMRINAKFSMRLSLTVKHNTDVPADRRNTDTTTSVNLVYDLW